MLRAMVPLAAMPVLANAMPREGQAMVQPAAGVAEIRLPPALAGSALRRLRAAVGANSQVIVASAPPDAKTSLDVWGPPPPGFAIMRALKDALDPHGILNPGRFVGGI
ncbi:MAG: hypothetical protein E6I56_02355 [Chloroflexi bacterium]|nr:MAG: hypothetical protein E6I56_02355 [Chloroflexota bacterium]